MTKEPICCLSDGTTAKVTQIKDEIIARVSAYFGFDLPVTFPYYQGANAGQPIQNPLATPKP